MSFKAFCSYVFYTNMPIKEVTKHRYKPVVGRPSGGILHDDIGGNGGGVGGRGDRIGAGGVGVAGVVVVVVVTAVVAVDVLVVFNFV